MEHLSAAVSCKSCTSFMFEMVTQAEMAEPKSIRTGDISLSSRILCDLISLCDRGGGVEQLVDCQADGGEDGEQSGLGEGSVGQLSAVQLIVQVSWVEGEDDADLTGGVVHDICRA